MAETQSRSRYSELMARVWADEAFHANLLKNPRAVLSEYGISIPADTEIRIVENTDRVFHLTIPAKPAAELSDEQLDRVSGAGDIDACCCCDGW